MFDSATLQIGLFEARGVSDACGDVERQDRNAVVLPLAGVFAKHDAPGRQVIGTPSHAVFVAADTPYRISFPGGIGDRALILRFGEGLAPEYVDRRGDAALTSNGLLPAPAMMLRNLLGARLGQGEIDEFEVETIGLDLLNVSFDAMRQEKPRPAAISADAADAGAGARQGSDCRCAVAQMECGAAGEACKPFAIPSLPRVSADGGHLDLRLRAAGASGASAGCRAR
jgi:hypothetical protein